MFRKVPLKVAIVAPRRVVEQNQRVEIIASNVQGLEGGNGGAYPSQLAVSD